MSHTRVLTLRQKELIITTALKMYDAEESLYTSPASKSLYILLSENDHTTEQKWEAIQQYLVKPENVHRTFHDVLKRTLADANKQRRETILKVAHYSADAIHFFSEQSKTKIIDQLLHHLKLYRCVDRHLTSLELTDVLKAENTYDEKWNAILEYCKDKNNHYYYLYGCIYRLIRDHNLDEDYVLHAQRKIHEDNLSHALYFLKKIQNKRSSIYALIGDCHSNLAEKYSARIMGGLIQDSESQAEGNRIAVKNNHLAAYVNYQQAYIRNPKYKIKRDKALHHLLVEKQFSKYVSQAIENENTDSYFFNFSTRNRLNLKQTEHLIEKLETFATLPDINKIRLLLRIAGEYDEAINSLTASEESINLRTALTDRALTLDEQWLALEVYMLESRDAKFVNNGRKLFCLIDKFLEEATKPDSRISLLA